MINKIKKVAEGLSFYFESDGLLPSFRILSKDQGFGRTLVTKKPERLNGGAIPWYTYPAIEYLDQLDLNGMKIFEYGCGNSSLYFLNRGALVTSVEHDEAWLSQVKNDKHLGHEVILRKDVVSYSQAILESDQEYDIIVIDGIFRNECAESSLKRLSPGGVIILDNADWYTDVSKFLKDKGFFQVDFNGFGPCNKYCWTTSILFPAKNVLSGRLKNPEPIGGRKLNSKGPTW
jgi:hypothetical protein